MNLSWDGKWLGVHRDDAQEVTDKLTEAGMVEHMDFIVYRPRRASIVSGKVIEHFSICQILFCGNRGNEVLAKMILE